MDTFGIPDPSTPSLEDVQQQLEANASKIVPIINHLAKSTNALIDSNGGRIDRVVKRLNNSVNGHLRRNKAILGQIGSALQAPVIQGMESNQAKLAGAMTDPNVSAFVRQLPMPPHYILPDVPPPPPGSGVPGSDGGGRGGAFPGECPPGWTRMADGSCCPPAGMGVACTPASGLSPSSPHAPSPPYPVPPQPGPVQPSPPFPVPPQPGGGGYPPGPLPPGAVYVTAGGGAGFATAGGGVGARPSLQGCPPGWTDLGNGLCSCHVGPPGSLTPDMVLTHQQAWIRYRSGFRCGEPSAAPPAPLPPGTSPADCPQTYTVVQGPPCPQYLAIIGSPASWLASGVQLPPGWSALQTVTDTPENIQTMVNALIAKCVSATVPTTSPSTATV